MNANKTTARNLIPDRATAPVGLSNVNVWMSRSDFAPYIMPEVDCSPSYNPQFRMA